MIWKLEFSFRGQRWSPGGAGWYTMSANGPSGSHFIENALQTILVWRPDFDIDAVALPKVDDWFPTEEVLDALGNVREHVVNAPEDVLLTDDRCLHMAAVSAGQGTALWLNPFR